jgi:hypothetical protein
MRMTSYLHHNLILMKGTYPNILVKIRHDDVILRHVTSFSYIFPYYDVIDKTSKRQQKFCWQYTKSIYIFETRLVYELSCKKSRSLSPFVQKLRWEGSKQILVCILHSPWLHIPSIRANGQGTEKIDSGAPR